MKPLWVSIPSWMNIDDITDEYTSLFWLCGELRERMLLKILAQCLGSRKPLISINIKDDFHDSESLTQLKIPFQGFSHSITSYSCMKFYP